MNDLSRLYMLAFDHRENFRRGWFGIDGRPSADQAVRVADAKLLIFDGLRAFAGRSDLPPGHLGGLVDEESGEPHGIPELIRGEGFVLSMPVERSGAAEFEFEYGEDFAEHIERFSPDYAKVLVRYNPDGDRELNRRQAQRLRRLSEWLREHDRKLLFELLVPPEAEQLAAVDGDTARYEAELRPELVGRTITELQAAGIEPQIWKLEGMERRAEYEAIAERCRSGGRAEVSCVVLGSGADEDKVETWLREAAPVDAFIGFAIGRTIWGDPLSAMLSGELERDQAASSCAERFERFVDVWEQVAP